MEIFERPQRQAKRDNEHDRDGQQARGQPGPERHKLNINAQDLGRETIAKGPRLALTLLQPRSTLPRDPTL